MPSINKANDGVFYGWRIVAAFFIIGLILFGIRMSFGIFFKSIESEFMLSRTATSAIFSAFMAFGSISTILGGWASDRYGPRIIILAVGISSGLGLLLTSQTNAFWQLFITYSLMLSAGSVTFTVLSSTIARWFDHKRTFALSIAQSSSGFSMVFVAPLAAMLIANFGWRTSFVALGLTTWAVILLLAKFLKKEPAEIGAAPLGLIRKAETRENRGEAATPFNMPMARVLKTRDFWFFFFIFSFNGSCLFLVSTHLVPHATDIGISNEKAATIISMVGIAVIAGRILTGISAERIGKKTSTLICTTLQALGMLWLVQADSLGGFYLFALIYGFGNGGFATAAFSLMGDIFGLRRLGFIMGVIDVGTFIGAAIGPVVGGYIFDVTRDYTSAFLYGMSAMFISSILISLVKQDRHLVTKETAGNG